MILIDTGPLVALIHRDDTHHHLCKETFRSMKRPLATVWPAFTEAAYLLGFSWRAQDALWELVARGALSFLPLDEADAPRMRELMERYRDLPMDLADAALVRVAERDGHDQVFTLDRKDFSVYRPERIGAFDLIP
ncbi:MAG TPA: PIN domain-containing protein [Thermoanaerobaculia bacterium]|nr:PIN domain-containing protein [Thermoanaerobaculia bacterium]